MLGDVFSRLLDEAVKLIDGNLKRKVSVFIAVE